MTDPLYVRKLINDRMKQIKTKILNKDASAKRTTAALTTTTIGIS